MNTLKTIETLEKYSSIIENHDASKEAYEFIHNFELELAKHMLNEFSKDNLRKLAQVLLIITEEEVYNYTFPTYHSNYVNTGIVIG